MKEYKTVNGTSYDSRTPEEVIRVLESARLKRTRLHISLGETDNERGKLGRDWLEDNIVHGFIGRSTGSIKIPLLIHNRRSLAGPGLLDYCIVRIRTAAGGRVLSASCVPSRASGASSEVRAAGVVRWSDADRRCFSGRRTPRFVREHEIRPALATQARLGCTDSCVRPEPATFGK